MIMRMMVVVVKQVIVGSIQSEITDKSWQGVQNRKQEQDNAATPSFPHG